MVYPLLFLQKGECLCGKKKKKMEHSRENDLESEKVREEKRRFRSGGEGSIACDNGGRRAWSHVAKGEAHGIKVARWQNLIPSFPWIASGWRAWGRNPRKGRDQILQRSIAEP